MQNTSKSDDITLETPKTRNELIQMIRTDKSTGQEKSTIKPSGVYVNKYGSPLLKAPHKQNITIFFHLPY